MEELQNNLDQQLDNLAMLANVIEQEQLILCAGQIQSMVLQGVTEQKSALLSILGSLDQQRLGVENAAGIIAPYQHQPALTERWQRRQKLVEKLHNSNLHNSLLLNQHIDHNREALAILSAHHNRSSLYGPDGQPHGTRPLGRKIGI